MKNKNIHSYKEVFIGVVQHALGLDLWTKKTTPSLVAT